MDPFVEFIYWCFWLMLIVCVFGVVCNVHKLIISECLRDESQSKWMIFACSVGAIGFTILILIFHKATEYAIS